jgi:hypothetical protein
MPRLIADDSSEVARAIARTVVCDDPVDMVDPVGCEPDLRSGQKRRSGRSLLVTERLGAGEPGEAVDCRMQVGVSALRAS